MATPDVMDSTAAASGFPLQYRPLYHASVRGYHSLSSPPPPDPGVSVLAQQRPLEATIPDSGCDVPQRRRHGHVTRLPLRRECSCAGLPYCLTMEGLMKFKESVEVPQHFDDLQYYFNAQGELRHMITNKPFIYNYYKNEFDRNHKRYKILGDMITLYIYERLEKDCNLQRIPIPVDATDDEPKSFFFMSKELPSMQTNLFVLLQDRGIIRAGQWGQKVIFHHSLDRGSQIPYIKAALGSNGSVIVLNPNDNFVEMKEEPLTLVKTEEESCTIEARDKAPFVAPQQKIMVPKRCCSSPEEHTSYIWDHFISKSNARHISFIAHGYGGLVFMDLLCKKSKEVMSKVSAVAFIDSRHHSQHQARALPEIQAWIRLHCRSWVLSAKPLDRPTGSLRKLDCPKVSAGTENHELAPSVALQSIFRFLSRSSRNRRNSFLPAHTMITRSSSRCK